MDKKPFANPGPAGLMVLAFYLAALWPVVTHRAPHEMINVLIALGFAGGLVQFTAGIIDLKNGEIMTGNIMLAFSAFMWLGFWEFLGKSLGFIPENTSVVDGYVFIVMGILMTGFTVGHLKAPKITLLFMIFTDIFFLSAGAFFLTHNPTLWNIVGIALPLIILTILWIVFGTVLNGVFGKEIIPLGKPLIKD